MQGKIVNIGSANVDLIIELPHLPRKGESVTGGPFSHMDTVGIANVVATLDRLAQRHGERFAPPQLLRDMAAKGETFYGRAAAKKAA